MTVSRGFTIVVASALSFALAGGLVGWLLGTLAPDYYRVVFHLPDGAFNLPLLGVALGLTQGLTAGVIVGAVIVLSVAWYNSRIDRSPRAA